MTSKTQTKPRRRTTAAIVCILGAFAAAAFAFTGSASAASSCWYSLRGCVSVSPYYRNYPGYGSYRTPSYSYRTPSYSYSYRTPSYSYSYRTPSYSYRTPSYSYSYRTPSYLGYGSSYGAW
jgi:hypothetical protein